MSNRLPWLLLVLVTAGSSVLITYLVMRPASPVGESAELQTTAPRLEVTAVTSPSPTATSAPTTSPVPTGTATVAPTVAPTAPPKATPTPVTIDMPRAATGGGDVTGEHKGIFGIVYAAAGYKADTTSGRMHVVSYIPTVGSGEHPTATAWLQRSFLVPAGLGTRVEVQVSGNVAWSGVLAGNGAAGAGADVDVVLKLLEGTRLVTQASVHSKEVRESSLSVGGLKDQGSATPSLTANVVGGRTYTLRLEVECVATSGVVSASTHCIFGPSDTYPDGYVDWRGFTVRLAP